MSTNIDQLPEGGMGIKILSCLADEISYTRTAEQKNCLLIIKSYQKLSLEELQSHKTPLQKIHFQVKTDLKELERVLQESDQLNHLSISNPVLAQIQLILAEGFTNTVRYAHKDLPVETPIEIELMVFHEKLEIRIWDYGQPFDLEAKLCEIQETNQNPGSEGGRSLNFMSKLPEYSNRCKQSKHFQCYV